MKLLKINMSLFFYSWEKICNGISSDVLLRQFYSMDVPYAYHKKA